MTPSQEKQLKYFKSFKSYKGHRMSGRDLLIYCSVEREGETDIRYVMKIGVRGGKVGPTII